MTTGKLNQFWTLIIVLLVAIIVTGSIVAWTRYDRSQPIEITIPETPHMEPPGEIYISGAVNNPGLYPLEASDRPADLIQAAGGTTSNADLSQIRLYLPRTGEEVLPQKVNINRAELWMLQALPGIGPTRAQAIIDHRNQNGPFRSINELTKVEGIGTTTYKQIKPLITVAD